MAFSARTISREMEVEIGKAPPCLNPFLMGNPVFPPRYVCPWSSMSSRVFQSGMSNGHGALDLNGGRKREWKVVYVKYLFSKFLTQSDVGKLNRVLVPKHCAEECFPRISVANDGGNYDFLYFEDLATGFIWRFRFCLWNNSKSYVLTKGWNVFVKEKNLKKGDIVSFYRDASNTTSTNYYFIHVKPHTSTMSLPHRVPSEVFSTPSVMVDYWVHESHGFATSHGIVPALKPLSFGSGELMYPTNLMPHQTTFPESTSLETVREEKRLRLFGVDIDIPSGDYGDESGNGFTNKAP